MRKIFDDEDKKEIGAVLATEQGNRLIELMESKRNMIAEKMIVSDDGFLPEIQQRENGINIIINNPRLAKARALDEIITEFKRCREMALNKDKEEDD